MATEHKDILDPYRHEPKGADTAAVGTIYVADGAGGGVWEHTSNSVHGDMVITSGAVATVVAAAADATLNTDTDYVKVTAGWALGHMDGLTFNTDEIVVPVGGEYEIAFWADILVPKNNNFVGIKYAVNDTAPYSGRKIIAQSTTVNDYLNMSGFGIVTSLSPLDTLSIYVACSQADSVIIQEAGLLVKLLDEA